MRPTYFANALGKRESNKLDPCRCQDSFHKVQLGHQVSILIRKEMKLKVSLVIHNHLKKRETCGKLQKLRLLNMLIKINWGSRFNKLEEK